MNETDSELERMGDEIAELSAQLHAATYRLLVRLHEFDAREGWTGGFRSCAHWLSWRTGIDAGAAREKVRVARALVHVPQIGEAMKQGVLSYAVVRALTRVATPDNEAQLLDLARCATAAHVEKLVRAWRCADRQEEMEREQRRHESRRLTLYIDDDGSYVIRGRLDPETGAMLERALAAAVPPAREGDGASSAQRRVDSLRRVVELALSSVPENSRADRFQVMVHVDAEALADASVSGHSVLGDGIGVSAETARRIACDSARVVMMHDARGNVLDVGRRTRTVPTPIRRALEHRDRGCRFPGCGLRVCDAHHVRHWAAGGTTKLTNLVSLCAYHHRLVHEGGYRVTADGHEAFSFRRPDGRVLAELPTVSPLAEDAITSLERTHSELGIEIDAWTPTPQWYGERLDLGLALLAIRTDVATADP
jgi:hypothetical protein